MAVLRKFPGNEKAISDEIGGPLLGNRPIADIEAPEPLAMFRHVEMGGFREHDVSDPAQGCCNNFARSTGGALAMGNQEPFRFPCEYGSSRFTCSGS